MENLEIKIEPDADNKEILSEIQKTFCAVDNVNLKNNSYLVDIKEEIVNDIKTESEFDIEEEEVASVSGVVLNVRNDISCEINTTINMFKKSQENTKSAFTKSILKENINEKENLNNNFEQQYLICNFCKSLFKSKEELNNHEQRHKDNKFYKCEKCKKTIFNQQVKYHLHTHKIGKNNNCRFCNKKFFRNSDVKQHELTHVKDSTSVNCNAFSCDKCNTSYSSKNILIDHMKTHMRTYTSPEKPFKCNICSKTFVLESFLVYHNRIHMARKASETSKYKTKVSLQRSNTILKAKEHECTLCKKSFSNKKNLVLHMKIHESSEKLFKCNFCSEQFEFEYKLVIHKKIHFVKILPTLDKQNTSYTCKTSLTHEYKPQKMENAKEVSENVLNNKERLNEKNPPYKCDRCEKVFKRKWAFERHKKLYSECRKKSKLNGRMRIYLDKAFIGENKYKCGICEKIFLSRRYLSGHMRVHAERLFECNFCERKFNSTGKLASHLRKHTTKPIKKFICQICKKSYVGKRALKKHEDLHKLSYMRFCNICKVGRKSDYELSVHMFRKHEGIKPLGCDICNKRFLREADYLTHTKKCISKNFFTIFDQI